MPSGKTHDAISWWTTPFVVCLTWSVTHTLSLALTAGVSYLFAGLMFSGDLDLKSVQYKRWGHLRWIWKPYQALVSHRSPFSHGPVLGVITRLLYLSTWILLLFTAWIQLSLVLNQQKLATQSYDLISQGSRWLSERWDILLVALVALWLGGLSHTLSDEVVSRWKRLRRRRLRRLTRNR